MPLPQVRRLGELFGTKNARETLHVGAQVYINFMSLTRRSGWLQGHISKQAARDAHKAEQARLSLITAALRHLTFTDIFTRGGDESLPRGQAVPTRDISVVWAADLLRPQLGAIIDHLEDEERATAWYDAQHMRLLESGARFEKATGRRWSMFWFEEGARTTPALHRFDADRSGIVTASERKEALRAWRASYDATANVFTKRTGTGYRVLPGQMPHERDIMALRPHGGVVPSWTSWLSTIPLGDSLSEKERMATAGKLADAVASQASFVGRILALGPRIITDEWIDRAISRYADFLQLARDHPREVLVPTLDIDLIWHAHMLSPLDYRDDCHALLGRLLSHDDQKEALELKDAFDATAERWHESHGTPYVWREKRAAPPQQRQQQQSGDAAGHHYSGCGSCGWGDEQLHDILHHKTSEPEAIEEAYGDRGTESGGEGDDEAPLETTALQEPEPWAVDAPRAPGADQEDGVQLMEDPWAAPPDSSDAAGSTGAVWTSDTTTSTSAESGGSGGSDSSWGWGGDGDGGGDGGGCGGGCGGD